MNNNIQVIIKSSTAEMSLNDHEAGIYIVPELNGLTGLPNIRTTSGVNAGYDGGWTTAQNYDARSIILRGTIANEDKSKVEQMRKQLVTLLGQGKKEPLTFDIVTETGKAYELQVRTIACDMAMQKVLTRQDFMITFRADDPLIYDNSAAGEPVTIQVQKALGGFQIDFELPLAIGGSEDAGIVENNGQEEVFPIVKMYGALHNPTIINQTTNQQMQLDVDLGYAQGAPINPVDVSGKTINISNGIEASLESVQIDGETSQNGTPTPSAPVMVNTVTGENVVKICGKNLFDGGNADYTAGDAWEGYGNPSYLVIDNGYKFENRYRAIAFEFDNLVVGQQYVVSFDVIGNHSFTAGVGVNVYNGQTGGSSQTYNGSTASQRISFTFTAAANNRIAFNSGTTADTVMEITSIQLESGSTATAYESYQGQSYEINLGKNLIDGSNGSLTQLQRVSSAASGNGFTLTSTASSGACYATLPIPNIGELLGRSIVVSYNGAGDGVDVKMYYLDSSNHAVSPVSGYSNQKITLPTTLGNNKGIGLIFYTSNNGSATYTDIQVELGSQATSYAAYFEPIELCKIGTYQDYIYKSGGKWYVHKETGKVDLASLTWINTTDTIRGSTGATGIKYAPNNQTIVPAYAECYSIRQGSGLSNFRNYLAIDTNRINVNTGSITITPTGMFYYPLATPTDTEITNSALIEQLDNLASAALYSGTNNIFTVTANEAPTLEIGYYTDRNPDIRDEVIIDSRLRTITLNGTDIYSLQTEGSEFLMLAPGQNRLLLRSDNTSDNGYAEVNYKQGYLSI